MPKSSVNASLSSYDDIFSTEESRQEEQREQVRQIPIGELFPFKNHPFKVLDDDSMSDTVESVKQYGVLSPLIARPRPKGGYEIISGHRRQHAAELAGLETLPVIVRQMDDDAAIILMVDSNLQREHMLFSILFPILFLVVLGMILYTIIGNISTWNKNNHSPRLTVPATVVAKRTEVSRHHTDNTMAHTFTTYYVTFQVESGDRMELTVSGSDYGMLVEGDIGKLSFQGTRYLGYERN